MTVTCYPFPCSHLGPPRRLIVLFNKPSRPWVQTGQITQTHIPPFPLHMMTYTPEQTLFPPSTTHFEGLQLRDLLTILRPYRTILLSIGTFRKAYSISFSANGKFLAAGIDDCVYIWNTATWKVELCYQKNFSKILSVCWDASGILLFGCDGGWLTIISSGDEVLSSSFFHFSRIS